ncbi:MAG TPA: DUF6580 family putative transport protein [Candidatus Dormibacteraeota bacterium]|nr:DUF6580 family putative transport protein [Candidatus Dormibacteraeota bacterium]
MKLEGSEKEGVIVRTLVVLAMILLAAALRIAPHPWNLTPVGAMALFSGAMVRDRRLAFLFPLLALFAGDLVIGLHTLMPWVYASFLVNVALGNWLRSRPTPARIGAITLLGAIQFFVITNFSVWATYDTYPRTASGLVACYIAGIPYFWNTLAGDFLYAALLFGGFAIAVRLVPSLRLPTVAVR